MTVNPARRRQVGAQAPDVTIDSTSHRYPPADPTGSDENDDPVPIAAFIYDRGKKDQTALTIKVARFSGRVDQFDANRAGEIRKNGEAFIAKNEKIALGNGMPAYFLKSNAGSEAGHYVETLEYLVCDGTRSIDIAIFGGEGTFDETKARAAFASLYVVAYPKRRP